MDIKPVGQLTLPQAVAVARSIVQAASREITDRNLPYQERFAVRGAALRALDDLYYDLMKESARDLLRKRAMKRDPSLMGSFPSRDYLLELAGWGGVS